MDQAVAPSPFGQLLPMILIQLIFVAAAWWIAPKMGKNRWLLAALCAIPLFGMFVGMLLPLIALGSVLDKLNKLSPSDRSP